MTEPTTQKTGLALKVTPPPREVERAPNVQHDERDKSQNGKNCFSGVLHKDRLSSSIQDGKRQAGEQTFTLSLIQQAHFTWSSSGAENDYPRNMNNGSESPERTFKDICISINFLAQNKSESKIA